MCTCPCSTSERQEAEGASLELPLIRFGFDADSLAPTALNRRGVLFVANGAALAFTGMYLMGRDKPEFWDLLSQAHPTQVQIEPGRDREIPLRLSLGDGSTIHLLYYPPRNDRPGILAQGHSLKWDSSPYHELPKSLDRLLGMYLGFALPEEVVNTGVIPNVVRFPGHGGTIAVQ